LKNCIVESQDTLQGKMHTTRVSNGVKIVVEKKRNAIPCKNSPLPVEAKRDRVFMNINVGMKN
jgi:hypothetical protein